jgi:anti-anti-sigma factor
LVLGLAPAKLYVADLGKQVVLRISGRANCLSSVPFKEVVNGLIERGRRGFTLDLSDCQLMDSTFLGVLVGLNRSLADADRSGGFSLYQPTEPVRVLLDNLGILELFSTADSLGQAEDAEPVEAGGMADKTELTRTSLEAHRTLIDTNTGNEAKFKEVTRFLEEDLKRQEAAGSSS